MRINFARTKIPSLPFMKTNFKILALLLALYAFGQNASAQTSPADDPEVRAYFKSDSTSFKVMECYSAATPKTAAACKAITVIATVAGGELAMTFKEGHTLNKDWATYKKVAPLDQIDFSIATIKAVKYKDATMQPKQYYKLALVIKDKKAAIRSDSDNNQEGKKTSSTPYIDLLFHTVSQAEKVKAYLQERGEKTKAQKEQETKAQGEKINMETDSQRVKASEAAQAKADSAYAANAKASVARAKAKGTYKERASTKAKMSVVAITKLVHAKNLDGLLVLAKSAGIKKFDKKQVLAKPFGALEMKKDSAEVYEFAETITIAEGIYASLKIMQFKNGKIEVLYPYHWFELENAKKEIIAAGFVKEFSNTYTNAEKNIRVVIPKNTNYQFPYIVVYPQ